MANMVQRLYETCKDVFKNGESGYVPPPADIQRLTAVLDGLNAEDMNLTSIMRVLRRRRSRQHDPPAVIYIHIYECDQFSIGIFCLPACGVIPLHDHPGMTVLSKLLFGSMHLQSFDWVEIMPSSIKQPQPGRRLAKVKVDADLSAPCDVSVLFPAAGGNMHCFRALTPCAILDVLGPPYSQAQARNCTYYHHFPFTPFSSDGGELNGDVDGEGYAWLEERAKPESFIVAAAPYSGPTILER
ncbi:PREDICTED: plant cysteine oxidase 2-like [Ipomoea nil]|uniref:plant cysteine oxidase 2-like n=1 Tax=Ipomoea nil TaxID=35883 RepID=UPI000901841C|nr:PREDICTED: plant cysteine oxidase 2-like [Ipomoea nil]